MIKFRAVVSQIGSWTILQLPKNASAKLPSRGMVAVWVTINGKRFHIVLEPDGNGSHWFMFTKSMRQASRAGVGDEVTLALESTKDWPEPEVPADLKKTLSSTPHAYETWLNTTPAARWDWIRWIRATKVADTRKKRILAACDMLAGGKRRVCCFDRSQCTEPRVSQGGVLLFSVKR